MASTITIQQTITNFVLPSIIQRPFTGIGGATNEPGLTSANFIMQTIMQPPFRWEWNRKKLIPAFTCVAGQSDYPVPMSDFGWLEKAIITDPSPPPNSPTGPNYELELNEILGTEGTENRPQKLAVLLDDGIGNITFRVFPVPDKAYPIELDYQKAPILAASLGTTTWAPIPDKLAFLYEQGMLARAQMMYNQQLGLSNLEIFFRQLVAAKSGLNEMEKAIFLEDQLRPIRMKQNELQAAAQGKAARQ